MERGKFITLEGGEGTGKSTLIAALSLAMEQCGLDHIVTREPGGTPLAEAVRTLALSPPEGQVWSPLAHALLMNAARQDHLEKVIRPALEAGRSVVCDRFSDSTRAYQSVDGVSMAVLEAFEVQVVENTRPDLTLVLDGDPVALQKRRSDRGVRDHFEDQDLDFHIQIRAAFQAIAEAEPTRCVLIDAEESPAQVLGAAQAVLNDRFNWSLS